MQRHSGRTQQSGLTGKKALRGDEKCFMESDASFTGLTFVRTHLKPLPSGRVWKELWRYISITKERLGFSHRARLLISFMCFMCHHSKRPRCHGCAGCLLCRGKKHCQPTSSGTKQTLLIVQPCHSLRPNAAWIKMCSWITHSWTLIREWQMRGMCKNSPRHCFAPPPSLMWDNISTDHWELWYHSSKCGNKGESTV